MEELGTPSPGRITSRRRRHPEVGQGNLKHSAEERTTGHVSCDSKAVLLLLVTKALTA